MQILSFNFLMYTISGIWRPVEWSSNGIKLLYNVFTCIVLMLIYILLLTQFMDIVLVIDNVDDFVVNTLMWVSIVAVCCKATVVVIRRDAIINLVQMLLTEPCKPTNEDEITIQEKFDMFIRSWSIKYTVLALSSLTSVTLGSVLNVIQGQLPYRVWVPCDFNVPLIFWTISIQQIVALIFATTINIGTETLVFGLFLQTCVQLEIFENRLRKLVFNQTAKYTEHSFTPSNKKRIILSRYISHHLKIYQYANTTNIIFSQVLFVQFFGSILILCTSVFYVSAHFMEPGSSSLVVYTICMFVQIYVYCWSGNEVMLKSTTVGDTVYHLDWPLLSISEKKDLLIIMMRSRIPIKFTSSFLITISLESYSNILKTSYSAFNLLQQS